jgi:hypothetical protein
MPKGVTMIKNLASVICFSIIFLLGGCIDYDEEMWLNTDLSGKVAMTISVREELVQGKTGFERDLSEASVRRDVQRIPGVKLESFSSYREAGKIVAKLLITFDAVEKLTRQEKSAANITPISFLGSIRTRQEGRKFFFERALPAIPDTQTNSFGTQLFVQGLSALMLSNNYLTYRLHIPGELITANTQHVDGESRTVDWKFTLAQAMRDPPDMQVQWKGPLYKSTILIVSVIVLLVIALIFYLLRKRHGK